MALILPKIVYPSAGGNSVTFVRPPRNVPAATREATRHRNVSSAGVVETILEKIHTFFDFEVEWVGIGLDAVGWDNFIQQALTGIPFDYYPDSTAAVGHTWAASTPYQFGQVVYDGAHYQLCIAAGTSQSPGPPTWDHSGGTTNDNGVIWRDLGTNPFITYTLEDDAWNLPYKSLGQYNLKLRFRLNVPWP